MTRKTTKLGRFETLEAKKMLTADIGLDLADAPAETAGVFAKLDGYDGFTSDEKEQETRDAAELATIDVDLIVSFNDAPAATAGVFAKLDGYEGFASQNTGQDTRHKTAEKLNVIESDIQVKASTDAAGVDAVFSGGGDAIEVRDAAARATCQNNLKQLG